MATRTISASGGTRNWNDTASWDEAVVPTSADDVVARADGTSGNLTINVAAACKSMDLTNYGAKTLSHAISVTVSVGGSTAGAGNIAIKFSAAMSYSASSSTTSLWSFVGTFGTTPQTITSNGKVIRLATISGAGGSLQLTDAFNYGNGVTLTLSAGTFDTNGQNVSGGSFSTSGSTARTLTLGATTWTLLQSGTTAVWVVGSTTNYTFNRGTSTLNFAATLPIQGISAAGTFNNITASGPGNFQIGGGPTIAGNFTRSAPATPTVNDALTLGSNITVGGVFTATAGVGFRMAVQSSIFGTARTVTVNGSVSFTRIDFQDITAAGTNGTWNLSTVGGDAGGNTNITFRASVTFYWIGGTGNVSDGTKWSLSSGGVAAGFFPTPLDDLVFDANSFSAAGQTVTVDIPRLGRSVNFTGVTNTPTWAATVATTMFGSLTLVAGMTRGTFSSTLTMAGRAAATITTAGKQLPPLTLSTLGASAATGLTVTLNDDLDLGTNTLTHNAGVFDANGHNVTAGAVTSNSGTTRTLTMGTGTWTVAGVGSVWTINTTGLTLNVNTSRLVISDTSATTKTVSISQATSLYDLVIPASGAGQVNVLFTLSVNSITIGAGRTVQFQAGRTLTVTGVNGWRVVGTSGSPVTLKSSSSGSAWTVSVAAGVVASDWLVLSDSTATGGATFYAGGNSTNSGGNTGWSFSTYHVDSAAALTGTGSMTSVSSASSDGAASLTGTGSLTGTLNLLVADGAAVLTGIGNLAAVASASADAAAAMTGNGSMTAAGAAIADSTALLTGTGQLDAAGDASAAGSAALDGAGSLYATPAAVAVIVDGQALLTGSGDLSASSTASADGDAALTGTGTLAADGRSEVNGQAFLTGAGTLDGGTPALDASGSALLTGGGSLTGVAAADTDGAAALTGTGSIAANGAARADGQAALAGQGDLVVLAAEVVYAPARPGRRLGPRVGRESPTHEPRR